MSLSRMHLRFTAGVLCSSTPCLDSVDAPPSFAPEVMLASSPMWNGKRKGMVSEVSYCDNQVFLSRACFEHKLTYCFLNRTDQPNCHVQPKAGAIKILDLFTTLPKYCK